MKTGVELIAEERERQIAEEGYTTAHDDEHAGGQLAGAAACYAWLHARYIGGEMWRIALGFFPWAHEWWKPKDPIRDLARAGALIAAELDRLQRALAAAERPRIIVPK